MGSSSLVSYCFVFSYCSCGSRGKNTEVDCPSLLQWTTFCQTSPPFPAQLERPHRSGLSFIELDKAVVLMWLDWLDFSDYGFSMSAVWCRLATPTILRVFILPWMWGISSWLLQQSAATATYLGRGISPHWNHSWPWTWSSFYRPSWAHAATNPWTRDISPDYSLERLTVKLQLHFFVHLMQRTVSLENILMLGRNEGQGEGDKRGWDVWMASGIQWSWVSASYGSWWWTRNPGVLQSMGLHTVGHNWTNEMNWRL